MLPTFAALAGASMEKCLPLDGLDVSAALLGGKPSGRSEIVYNIEPFRAAIRQGDWKLVWQTLLPSRTELFNLADDPNETRDLSADHPQKVAELQARIEQLAGEAQKPLFFATGMKAVSEGIFGPAPIPTGEPSEELP
jgi:arylsulfatase A-like enzyme